MEEVSAGASRLARRTSKRSSKRKRTSSLVAVPHHTKCALCEDGINAMRLEDINLGKFLKSGSYGEVFEAEDKTTGEKFVLKKKKFPDPNDIDSHLSPDFIREVSALQALHGHPNIINMHGITLSSGPPRSDIALEAAKWSLEKDITETPSKYAPDSMDTKASLYQIIRGMHYTNSMGIWHRDLKPANILVMNDGSVKVTDFGLAKGGPFQWVKPSGHVFTLWYRAPEILLQQILTPGKSTYEYGAPSEVWSVGIVMWNLLAPRNSRLSAGGVGVEGAVDRMSKDERIETARRLHIHSRVCRDDYSYYKADQCEVLLKSELSNIEQLHQFMWSLGGDTFVCPDGSPIDKCKTELQRKLEVLLDIKAEDGGDLFLDPFRRASKSARQSTLRNGKIDPKSDAADLLFKMLDPNPVTRITLVDALTHPYFDDVRDYVENKWPAPQAPTPHLLNLQLNVPDQCETMFHPDSNLTMNMWKTIIDWLLEVMEEYHLTPGTLGLTIHLLRCFLVRRPVQKQDLQCYGLAAFYLASNYLELSHVGISDLQYISDNTCKTNSILTKAKEMFIVVGGQMHLTTSFVLLVDMLKDVPGMNAGTLNRGVRYADRFGDRELFGRMSPSKILFALEALNDSSNLSPYELASEAVALWNGDESQFGPDHFQGTHLLMKDVRRYVELVLRLSSRLSSKKQPLVQVVSSQSFLPVISR